MRNVETGKAAVEALLALGDGDSIVIDGKQWTSFEEHGFEVEDLRNGTVERVDRAEAKRRFYPTKQYEVVR